MKRMTLLVAFLVLVLGAGNAFAKVQGDAISVDIEFQEPQITRSAYGSDYSHIEMKGTRSLGEVGEPVLPVRGTKVLIPPETKVKNVSITLGEKVTLPGRFQIEPGQREYPLSQIDKIKISPDKPKPEVYQANAVYPANRHKYHSLQRKMGYNIAIVELHPVEYNPVTGEISYYKKMTVVVTLESDKAKKLSKGQPRLRIRSGIKEKDREHIQKFIDNKEDMVLYNEALSGSEAVSLGTTGITSSSGTQSTITPFQALGPIDTTQQYTYCIITDVSFASAFEPLKQRRTQKGLPATIVTTDWIYANYPGTRPGGGTDNATKIRNFIIDAYNLWGTRYALLAGDGDGANVGGESGNNIIPARGLADSGENNIPSDLYYACLDGTFDNNANGIYGEKTDGVGGGEVDLIAEVYVGRAPVDTLQEASNFVTKTFAYEDSTDNYLGKAYMLGEFLGFGGPAQYATYSMEEIRLGSNAHDYITQGFLSSPDKALDADTLYDAPEYTWSKSDLINIINKGVHILNHLGHANNIYNMKLTNADVDKLVNTKYFIGYSQGCYSGAFDNRDSNNNYLSSDSIVEHFIMNPTGAVAFVANSRYGWGTGNSTNGSSQFYDRQFWNAFFGEGINRLGEINQDSKENNTPYLNYGMHRWCYFELNLFGDPALNIHVPTNNLILNLVSYTISDPEGDNDNRLDPDERGNLIVNLTAFNQDAFNVSATLTSQDPYVTIEQNNSNYGNIAKGQIVNNSESPFILKISKNCSAPYKMKFTLTSSATGYSKGKDFFITIHDHRERQITFNTADQAYPVISGNYIVWQDYRNGNADIYMYDLTTNRERQITFNTAYHVYPVISGNYIVWEDDRNGGQYDIYMYDLTTNRERQITFNTADQINAVISGNYIVWEDYRNGNADIYLYDLERNSERQITTNSRQDIEPVISGNYIVWICVGSTADPVSYIHIYDLSRNIERQISDIYDLRASMSGQHLSISGQRIVWESNYDIYLYDLSINSKQQITYDGSNVLQFDPRISGQRIVWENRSNGWGDIYLYDIDTMTKRGINFDDSAQLSPSISGDRIVWEDYRNGNADIYMYDLGDSTPSTTPVVTDVGAYAYVATSLNASWSSFDPESGIAEYQYMITQDFPTGTVIRNWTSTGITPSVTATGLSLLQSKAYYFGVKAKNGAGLWSPVGYSDGIKVDTTLPSTPIVTDGGTYTGSANTLSATWSSSDAESGIAEYQYQIRQDSIMGAIIRDWTSTGSVPSVTASGLTLLQGKSYYFSVKAKNGAGLWSTVGYSDGIKVDTTIPPIPSVNANQGAYIASATTLTSILTSWDPESGIAEYQYQILQDSTSGTIIKDWTTTVINNTSTSFILSNIVVNGLTLQHGKTYYFAAKVKNGAGLWSPIAYSIGIKVDTTAPLTPAVTDQGTYVNSTTTLSANWISSDPESSITEYQYQITADSPTGTVIKNWTLTGTTASVTASSLTLSNGKIYYFAVKAKNGAWTWSSVGYSDGIKVDTTLPSTPIVTDGGTYTGSANTLLASWSSSDAESGIAEYQYQIRQDSIMGAIIRDWTSTGSVPSVTASGLTLLQGKSYYFSVKAKNGAGFWSAAGYSNGIKVDTSISTTPVVRDSGSSTTNTTMLIATWSSSDLESGVAEYQYKITQDSTTGLVIRNWTSTGSIPSVTATGLTLTKGKSYYFSVKAKNGAGLWSNVGYTDGITVQ